MSYFSPAAIILRILALPISWSVAILLFSYTNYLDTKTKYAFEVDISALDRLTIEYSFTLLLALIVLTPAIFALLAYLRSLKAVSSPKEMWMRNLVITLGMAPLCIAAAITFLNFAGYFDGLNAIPGTIVLLALAAFATAASHVGLFGLVVWSEILKYKIF